MSPELQLKYILAEQDAWKRLRAGRSWLEHFQKVSNSVAISGAMYTTAENARDYIHAMETNAKLELLKAALPAVRRSETFSPTDDARIVTFSAWFWRDE